MNSLAARCSRLNRVVQVSPVHIAYSDMASNETQRNRLGMWCRFICTNKLYCRFIQSSTVITRSNITWFVIWYDNDWGKICIKVYIHKSGVFLMIWVKIDRVITTPHCILSCMGKPPSSSKMWMARYSLVIPKFHHNNRKLSPAAEPHIRYHLFTRPVANKLHYPQFYQIRWKKMFLASPGVGVAKVPLVNFSVSKFSIIQKYLLYYLNHIHIWQLSCGDTCQI